MVVWPWLLALGRSLVRQLFLRNVAQMIQMHLQTIIFLFMHNCFDNNFTIFQKYYACFYLVSFKQGLRGQTYRSKGEYRHKNLLWSLKCVNGLILFALIRNSNGACFEICCCTINTVSLDTPWGCVLIWIFFLSKWYISKSVLVMIFPWVKLWRGMIAAQLTFSGEGSELAKI